MIFSRESRSDGSNSTSRRIGLRFFLASSSLRFRYHYFERRSEFRLESEEQLGPIFAQIVRAEVFKKFHLITLCFADREVILGKDEFHGSGRFIAPCYKKDFRDNDENTEKEISFPYRESNDGRGDDDRYPIPRNALRTIFELRRFPVRFETCHGIIVSQVICALDESLLCLRRRQADDLPRPRGLERPRRIAERRAGGRDIIEDDDVLRAIIVAASRPKSNRGCSGAVPRRSRSRFGVSYADSAPGYLFLYVSGRRSPSRRAISSAWLNPRSFRRRLRAAGE